MASSSEEKNPRGIPKAPFIDNIESHLGGPDVGAEGALKKIQDALAKYRYMDGTLAQRRVGLEEKIPEIRNTLDMVEFLRDRREGKGKSTGETEDDLDDLDGEDEGARKPLTTTFELNDTLYAEAELEDSDTVYLWLGANVMLSYKIPEAVELLKSRLAAAEISLKNTIEDLEFLREQITVMEVNTARVYNWDVKRRREKREKEGQRSSSTTQSVAGLD